MCKVKMFGAWLRMDPGATYRKLARALVTLGKRHIAEAMCTARGMKVAIYTCVFQCLNVLLLSIVGLRSRNDSIR